MTTVEIGEGVPCAPQACTLPTVQRPLRAAEFDQIFGADPRRVERTGRTRLRLVLDGAPHTESVARDLTARESACCSFFAFAFTRTGDELMLDVTVPPAHVQVLDGLLARAQAALDAAS
jgi:hypothetical protein